MTAGEGVKSAVVKEADATDRLMAKHGAVTTMRLLGYAYKLDTEGEEWLREHISRQQLNHVRDRFAEAGVPFQRGAIEWPRLGQVVVRAAAYRDAVRAKNAARKATHASQRAAKRPRPA